MGAGVGLATYGAAKRKKLKKPSKKRIKQTQQALHSKGKGKGRGRASTNGQRPMVHQQQVTMKSSSPKPPTKRMPQQIIIIKTRKGSRSPSPSNPNRTATATATATAPSSQTHRAVHSSQAQAQARDMSDDDCMTSGGSTPILSDGGDGTNSATSSQLNMPPLSAAQVIYEEHANDNKPDTPAPSNTKKTKFDEHLDMATSASSNSNHSNKEHFSESEDELDPLD